MLSAEITCMHVLPFSARKKKVYEYGGFVLCVGAQGSQRITVVSQTPDVAVGNQKVPTGTAGNDLNN